MRIRVTDGDTIEVKRTHVVNKLSDISVELVKLVADKLGVGVNDVKDKAVLSLKSLDSDVAEVIVLSNTKQYFYDIIVSKLTDTGFYDARNEDAVIIYDEDWKQLIK